MIRLTKQKLKDLKNFFENDFDGDDELMERAQRTAARIRKILNGKGLSDSSHPDWDEYCRTHEEQSDD